MIVHLCRDIGIPEPFEAPRVGVKPAPPPAFLFMAGDGCEASHAYMEAWCEAEAAAHEMEMALGEVCDCVAGFVPCPELELVGQHEDCRYGCSNGEVECHDCR